MIVDPERRRQVFLESHFTEIGNHLGQKKTVHRIQSRYYWLGIVKDVVDWVSAAPPAFPEAFRQETPESSWRSPHAGAVSFLVLLL